MRLLQHFLRRALWSVSPSHLCWLPPELYEELVKHPFEVHHSWEGNYLRCEIEIYWVFSSEVQDAFIIDYFFVVIQLNGLMALCHRYVCNLSSEVIVILKSLSRFSRSLLFVLDDAIRRHRIAINYSPQHSSLHPGLGSRKGVLGHSAVLVRKEEYGRYTIVFSQSIHWLGLSVDSDWWVHLRGLCDMQEDPCSMLFRG